MGTSHSNLQQKKTNEDELSIQILKKTRYFYKDGKQFF